MPINVVLNAGAAAASMERTDVGQVEVRGFPVGEHGRIDVVDDGPAFPGAGDGHAARGRGSNSRSGRERLTRMRGTMSLCSRPRAGHDRRGRISRSSASLRAFRRTVS